MVVATHNRGGLLPRLVEALRTQEAVAAFEVVFVDDASTDGTDRVLAGIAAEWAAVRVVRLAQNLGPAGARNAGWRAARGDIVAFTDDDCIPQPGWLAELVGGFASADVVQGRTLGNPTQPREGWFAWSPETAEANGFYETCNIAYRRSLLEAVDGFDDEFRTHASRARDRGAYVAPAWGEDTDLALRVLATGARATFVPEAVVWHDVKPGRLADRLRDLPRRGGVVAAVKRHPELRRAFHSPVFSQRAHAYVLVASVGAALVAGRPTDVRRWAAAAALALPWARERGQYYPRSVWPRVLPQWFVVDVADVAVMAAASVRNRTLFL